MTKKVEDKTKKVEDKTKKVEDKTKAEEYWLSAQDDFGREALEAILDPKTPTRGYNVRRLKTTCLAFDDDSLLWLATELDRVVVLYGRKRLTETTAHTEEQRVRVREKMRKYWASRRQRKDRP